MQEFLKWCNDNQGTLTLVLFVITATFGWVSGIFSSLRSKPNFRIDTLEGPTFACTFGTGRKFENYDTHRTGIAIYLEVSNIGSEAASIIKIEVGYHWAIQIFRRDWWRYGLGWHWIRNQAIALADFQAKIGEHTKFYPFLFQKSSLSGWSSDTFLEVGKTTNGVAYFEQEESYGACFPVSFKNVCKMRVRITDSFRRTYSQTIRVPKISLSDAKKYNPSFGDTLATLHAEDSPIELPIDANGNLIVPALLS